jgi:ABC-type Fe3+/spermidine/putrescine transport system ATPase subunit
LTHLSVEGLSVRYGTVLALDRLDLAVGRGEIFVLLGGSGSGKTTLLRCLGGFLRPEAGRVVLDGREITALPPHRRPVNTMFQSYALFPHMTVADNIGFGLRRQGVARAEVAHRVAELLELVRLPGFADRKVTQLSGGQQQRVALARSLAPRPALLLLDEPLSALDRALRDQTRGELVALLRRLGTTAILVTHDQDEALATADRVAVLDRGHLVQIGPPDEVYERPASRFVAEFLGAANILPATVRADGPDGTLLDLPGIGAALAPPGSAAAGARVHLALRPERLRLDAAASPAPNRLQAEVVERAYRGAAVDHVLRLADGTLLRVTEPLGQGGYSGGYSGSHAGGHAGGHAAPAGAASVCWTREACIVLPE